MRPERFDSGIGSSAPLPAVPTGDQLTLELMPASTIRDYLDRDHARLARILDRAASSSPIDIPAYQEFRAGLLRHIGLEEKILLPAAKAFGWKDPRGFSRQLKLDHSALAALLVPTPTGEIVARIRGVLEAHNSLEEADDGVYAQCSRALCGRDAEILASFEASRDPKLAPHFDGPRAQEAIERNLRAAGRA